VAEGEINPHQFKLRTKSVHTLQVMKMIYSNLFKCALSSTGQGAEENIWTLEGMK
jgi:hypothetical protein